MLAIKENPCLTIIEGGAKMGRGNRIDGADAIEANAARIMEQYSPLLPFDLQVILNGYACIKNRVGCSTAGVYRYKGANDSFYLKIARDDSDIRCEHELLLWMNGKLPVPEIRCWHELNGLVYLLMSELPYHTVLERFIPETEILVRVYF